MALGFITASIGKTVIETMIDGAEDGLRGMKRITDGKSNLFMHGITIKEDHGKDNDRCRE